ncbi:hypothetical protein B0H19DRAFT_1194948 [Mycena capillaripes]|nr:hypothetical protein B0H19DRAFT_1194948 [Mycena capillaripes]
MYGPILVVAILPRMASSVQDPTRAIRPLAFPSSPSAASSLSSTSSAAVTGDAYAYGGRADGRGEGIEARDEEGARGEAEKGK